MNAGAITVVADDLTGAAECAAVLHGFGARAEVTMAWEPRDVSGALCIDTDSRLLLEEEAAARVRRVGRALTADPARFVFKKVDSVLRGNVRAETAALAEVLGRRAVLLAPASPSLGRILAGGRYSVDSRPLHETGFSRDPHHPAWSSDVGTLVGGGGAIAVRGPDEPGGIEGFTVGETASADDMRRWAERVGDDVLPAGSAEFLRALMAAKGAVPAPGAAPEVPGPALLVAGSTSDACRANWAALRDAGGAVFLVQAGGGEWTIAADAVRARLSGGSLTAVAADVPASFGRRPARLIEQAFARLAAELWESRAFGHLMIEGGATATAVLRRLGWTRLSVLHAWGPGAVSLRPAGMAGVVVTVKPGSYPWPAGLMGGVLDHGG